MYESTIPGTEKSGQEFWLFHSNQCSFNQFSFSYFDVRSACKGLFYEDRYNNS